ncbi:MAG: hypothetical protein IT581_22405 [Verrucomicrobiales bacterium]|nr:hypothetical protein [Verrucomicrobiales bacterium]
MKTNLRLLTLAVALGVAWFTANAPAAAAEPHAHAHIHKATPKGGRLLDKTEPHAEFVVEKDRTVTINFYTEEMKPVAATTQTVTVVADAKGGKQTLQFEKKGDSLVSKSQLPEGDGYNLVVQFKQTAEARPVNLRFKLDLALCAECKRAEYACTCEH